MISCLNYVADSHLSVPTAPWFGSFPIFSPCEVSVLSLLFSSRSFSGFPLLLGQHHMSLTWTTKLLTIWPLKTFPVSPPSMLPLTVSLSATPTFFIIQDAITTPKCQPLKSTKAHWLLSSCGSRMYQQWQEVHWSGEESMANYILAGASPEEWHTLVCSQSVGKSGSCVHASLHGDRETQSSVLPGWQPQSAPGHCTCHVPSHAFEYTWSLFFEHLFLHFGG